MHYLHSTPPCSSVSTGRLHVKLFVLDEVTDVGRATMLFALAEFVSRKRLSRSEALLRPLLLVCKVCIHIQFELME